MVDSHTLELFDQDWRAAVVPSCNTLAQLELSVAVLPISLAAGLRLADAQTEIRTAFIEAMADIADSPAEQIFGVCPVCRQVSCLRADPRLILIRVNYG